MAAERCRAVPLTVLGRLCGSGDTASQDSAARHMFLGKALESEGALCLAFSRSLSCRSQFTSVRIPKAIQRAKGWVPGDSPNFSMGRA